MQLHEFKRKLQEIEAIEDEAARMKALDIIKSVDVYDGDTKVEVETIEVNVKHKVDLTDSPIGDALVKKLSEEILAEARKRVRENYGPPMIGSDWRPRGRARALGDSSKALKWGLLAGALAGHEKCRKEFLAITKGHIEGTNTAGGYLVPQEMLDDIIDLREQYGVFRRNARIVPMIRDTMAIPRRTGGLTTYWPGEAGTITESTKSWDQVTLTAKKLAVMAKYSSELKEDALVDIGDDLAREIVYAFSVTEDRCGFLGDGSATYAGITGVVTKLNQVWPSTTSDSAGVIIASGNTMAEVTHNDLVKVVAALPQYAADSGNARWYCSRAAWANVFGRLTTNVATGMGTRKDDIAGVLPQTYLGYPIEITQTLPATDANSQILVLFGDLSQAAMFGDRREVQIAIADQRYFETDQIAIRGTERFDINIHSVGDGSNASGPIIGLRTAAS